MKTAISPRLKPLALLAITVALIASTCGFQEPPLLHADPRLLTLDPLDSQSPELDLIGLSTSSNADSVRFNIEFFDLNLERSPEVTFELDLWPDPGMQREITGDWDLCLKLTTQGISEFVSHIPGLDRISAPIIEWDEARDFLNLTFTQLPLLRSAPFLIQISVGEPGAGVVADVLGPIPSDGQELRTAELMLIFWNSFSANTPADTLRSWDGAHKGPAGERFGLTHLLQAVQDFSIPITLLDLNTPDNLAGLEFLGHISSVHSLQNAGLLSLPQTLPADVDPNSLTPGLTQQILSNRSAVYSAYGLQPSSWINIQGPGISRETLSSLTRSRLRGFFYNLASAADSTSRSRVYEASGFAILPLPNTDTARSAGYDGGLNLEWRSALLHAALDNEPGTLIILGGSFTDTFWGDPRVVRDSLAWLAAHSWIRILNLETLDREAWPVRPISLEHVEEPADPSITDEQTILSKLDDNPISSLTLDLYARTRASKFCPLEADSIQPNCDPEMEAKRLHLRALARTTVSIFVFASEWAQSTACSGYIQSTETALIDVDGDGVQEAVLRSDRMLAIIDPQGGRLVGLFGCTPGDPATSIISQRATAAIGISDPSQWYFQRGEIGEWTDPLIDGGFVHPADAGLSFDLEQSQDGITVNHPLGRYRVQYTLNHNQLRATLKGNSSETISFELPFALAPERLLRPGFMEDYYLERHGEGFTLGLRSGLQLEVTINASAWQLDSFLDSPASTMAAEDPNLETTTGHYLPFPFTLLKFSLGNSSEVSIMLTHP